MDVHTISGFQQRGDVVQDLAEGITRIGSPRFAAAGNRSGAKKYAKGISRWPVGQFPDCHLIASICFHGMVDRNGEVELIAPAMSMRIKRQLGDDLSRGGRIVQLCRQLHVTHGDNDRSRHRLLSDRVVKVRKVLPR